MIPESIKPEIGNCPTFVTRIREDSVAELLLGDIIHYRPQTRPPQVLVNEDVETREMPSMPLAKVAEPCSCNCLSIDGDDDLEHLAREFPPVRIAIHDVLRPKSVSIGSATYPLPRYGSSVFYFASAVLRHGQTPVS